MGSSTNKALDDKAIVPGLCDGDKAASQFQVRHHYHHYHLHHHHHVHETQQQQESATQAEGNAANYGSGSGGSNNKSNGENGSCGEKAIAEGGDNGVDEKGKTGNLSGSGSASGVDQDRLAQREAALNKFRQKKKKRCFEKKVSFICLCKDHFVLFKC
ncbi:putative transcription factor C2C2-CO-like family [Helianthus anomalus]